MMLSYKEWLYASICFVVGSIMLYHIYSYQTLPREIMMPITLIGIISFWLFLRSISNNQEKEENKNQHQYN